MPSKVQQLVNVVVVVVVVVTAATVVGGVVGVESLHWCVILQWTMQINFFKTVGHFIVVVCEVLHIVVCSQMKLPVMFH